MEPTKAYEQKLPEASYPPYVITLEDKRRWDLATEAAEAMFEGVEPGEFAAQVWSATRSLYHGPAATGEGSPDDDEGGDET